MTTVALAPRSLRLAAFVIDVLVVGLPTALVFGLKDNLQPHGIAYLVVLVIPAIYFTLLNALGQTLGKRFLGLHLCDATTGGRIGVWRAGQRYFAVFGYATLALPLLADVLWSFRDRYRRTWHDMAVGSVVTTQKQPAE